MLKNSLLVRKLPLLLDNIFLNSIFLFQDLTNKELVFETRVLAANLEHSVFPPLQEIAQTHIVADIPPDGTTICLAPYENKPAQKLQGTSKLGIFLHSIGVRQLNLDTRLESNQVIDSLKLLLHTNKSLQTTAPKAKEKLNFSTANLASAILSQTGLNKFCTNIRFDPTEQILHINYSYCELFYTAVVNNVLSQYTKTKNHRAIFALAPKTGFFAAMLFLLHHLFWCPTSMIALIAAVIGAIGIGFLVAYQTNTIASIIYDQEHRDKILQENIKEIKALSYLPVHNPNPILKIGRNGEIIFANKAASNLAHHMTPQQTEVTEILPENYINLISHCLKTKEGLREIEAQRHGKTIRYDISPFPKGNTVLASGTDITRKKELETELRNLNQHLEQRVIKRTEELQSTQDITILSLSSLAETRDQETGDHIQRTRLYVKILAEHLRKKENFRHLLDDDKIIDLLYRSAPLHDIGKVGIPDSILLKPGQLTTEEFDIMKTHAKIGGDSFQWAVNKLGEQSFLKFAREIAYYHHEKWDGSGYPFNLKGNDIPIPGRLMALADVYDALTSERVYKKAFSHEKSKQIILQGRGTHFDPELVDAFSELEEQFILIQQQYKHS